MITVKNRASSPRPVHRFDLSLPFSERRLLLLLGDLLVILLAGAGAFYLHWLLV
jgi:hypothetical protein